jgi:hypothetical protein
MNKASRENASRPEQAGAAVVVAGMQPEQDSTAFAHGRSTARSAEPALLLFDHMTLQRWVEYWDARAELAERFGLEAERRYARIQASMVRNVWCSYLAMEQKHGLRADREWLQANREIELDIEGYDPETGVPVFADDPRLADEAVEEETEDEAQDVTVQVEITVSAEALPAPAAELAAAVAEPDAVAVLD